ncbi:hypothetical protein GCM10008965_46670 [Methylorubrum aminovorans]
MLGDLAQHLVGEDLSALALTERHDGGGGLVAGGLDAKDLHEGHADVHAPLRAGGRPAYSMSRESRVRPPAKTHLRRHVYDETADGYR